MQPTASRLLILVFSAGCGTGDDSASRQRGPDPAAIRAAIDANNANATRWYAAAQIDSLAMLFAEDAWQMPPNSAPLVGRDSIAAFWRTATSWGQWQFDLRAQDVEASGPLAVERGQFSLKFTAGPGAPIPSMEDRGNYVAVWKQQPDSTWRIIWDAPVSSVPLAGPPPGR